MRTNISYKKILNWFDSEEYKDAWKQTQWMIKLLQPNRPQYCILNVCTVLCRLLRQIVLQIEIIFTLPLKKSVHILRCFPIWGPQSRVSGVLRFSLRPRLGIFQEASIACLERLSLVSCGRGRTVLWGRADINARRRMVGVSRRRIAELKRGRGRISLKRHRAFPEPLCTPTITWKKKPTLFLLYFFTPTGEYPGICVPLTGNGQNVTPEKNIHSILFHRALIESTMNGSSSCLYKNMILFTRIRKHAVVNQILESHKHIFITVDLQH